MESNPDLPESPMLTLKGRDAVGFAHGQFTSDVRALDDGAWQWSAWLDAQGRVRNVFALLRENAEALRLWLPRGSASRMAAELRRFVLRAKVGIEVELNSAICRVDAANPDMPSRDGGWSIRLPGDAHRHIVIGPADSSSQPDPDMGATAAWVRADIDAGLPWIDEANSACFTPMALGLQHLKALGFDKGCYPGQEIVARLHYRGGNKRGCHIVASTGPASLPAPGARLAAVDAARGPGQVLYAAPDLERGFRALAVLDLETPPGSEFRLAEGPIARVIDPVLPAQA